MVKNGPAFYPGPVLPPKADSSPLGLSAKLRIGSHLFPFLLHCEALDLSATGLTPLLIAMENNQSWITGRIFNFEMSSELAGIRTFSLPTSAPS